MGKEVTGILIVEENNCEHVANGKTYQNSPNNPSGSVASDEDMDNNQETSNVQVHVLPRIKNLRMDQEKTRKESGDQESVASNSVHGTVQSNQTTSHPFVTKKHASRECHAFVAESGVCEEKYPNIETQSENIQKTTQVLSIVSEISIIYS